MIKPIVTDVSVLSTISKVPDEITAKRVVQDLLDTAAATENCAGLAAIQIGEPYRIFVARIGEEGFKPFINPRWVSMGGGVSSEIEGCLSFPGKQVVVRRLKEVKLATGERFKGFLARVIQHEMDHFDGKTIMR